MAGPMGSQRLAVLLCGFADTANTELNPRSFYDELFRRGSGGLEDYWRAASHGGIDLAGTEVFGWTTLPQTRAEYLAGHDTRRGKIDGAIEAFPEVDFARYVGVLAMFNADVQDGGRSDDGVLVNFDAHNTTYLAHETGHLFGMGHSFDQSDRKLKSWSAPGEYYDAHDVMSAMNVLHHPHPRFGPSGPLLSAAFMDEQGWLDPKRIWKPPHAGSMTETVELVSLGHPEVPGYLAASIGGSLYVELRTADGWDRGLPRAAVLIHELTGRSVVAMTKQTGPTIGNRSGWNHEWLPGEVFGPTSPVELDVMGGVQVQIESFDLEAKKAKVRIRRQAARPVAKHGRVFGGIAGGGDGIVILPNGRVVKVPPHSPMVRALLRLTALAARIKQSFVRSA